MTVRQQFGDILNRVALQGAEVTIERAGKAIARIVPIAAMKSNQKHDFRSLQSLSGEPWKGVNPDAYVRKERDSW